MPPLWLRLRRPRNRPLRGRTRLGAAKGEHEGLLPAPICYPVDEEVEGEPGPRVLTCQQVAYVVTDAREPAQPSLVVEESFQLSGAITLDKVSNNLNDTVASPFDAENGAPAVTGPPRGDSPTLAQSANRLSAEASRTTFSAASALAALISFRSIVTLTILPVNRLSRSLYSSLSCRAREGTPEGRLPRSLEGRRWCPPCSTRRDIELAPVSA